MSGKHGRAAPLERFWNRFPLKTSHGWLNLLLLAAPTAIGLDLPHAPALAVFIAAAMAIAPLAGVLGEATGTLSSYPGPAVGGFVNATLRPNLLLPFLPCGQGPSAW
jgi:Ca2+:H+ antiporter